MVKKVRQSTGQIEKEKQTKLLQQRLQELVDTKERWLMSEFRESWNKKNPEKITELIKLNDIMICRFSGNSVSIKVKTMILG